LIDNIDMRLDTVAVAARWGGRRALSQMDLATTKELDRLAVRRCALFAKSRFSAARAPVSPSLYRFVREPKCFVREPKRLVREPKRFAREPKPRAYPGHRLKGF